MGNTTKRCEAPTSEVDDCAPRIFGTVAHVTCGKPAEWFVETDRGDWHACESCARDALLYTHDTVIDAMLGRSRVARISDARQRLWAALWRAGWSIGEIGRSLGRDHTTVISGLRRVVPGDEYASNVVGRYSASRLGSYRGRVRVSL
jgi:hypothetical protein